MEYQVFIWCLDTEKYWCRAQFCSEDDARRFVEAMHPHRRHKLSRFDFDDMALRRDREVEVLGIWEKGAWLSANVEF